MIRNLVWQTKITGKELAEIVMADNRNQIHRPEVYVALFSKKFGHIMHTMATEFVVIESLALSPQIYKAKGGRRGYHGGLQIRINTTEYYLYPDGSRSPGISNSESCWPGDCFLSEGTGTVYILPGQNWEIICSIADVTRFQDADYIYAFLKYSLYTDEDAVNANLCLDMGLPVTPENVILAAKYSKKVF